ncbi:hypothetical protein QJU11_09975 [Pasteurella atlantica]|uniref:hypothetical protein n=1 Tax=Phocoenobacter atlanticus TaxID=3416742 RepID=UPI002777B8AE|nr:hypothetical protein [Pasteurella atlantica]MDP8042518.1 hypothetical protein [Pasteurella atlantica]
MKNPKLEKLEVQLVKAIKLKEQAEEKIKTLQEKIDSIKNEQKLEVANTLLSDPEKLKYLLEMEIITPEQYDSLA